MDACQIELHKYLDFINNRTVVRLGLDSWRHLVQLLPKAKPIVITVAGTNGKGSFVAIISKALTKAGIANAAYTSPHLFDFKERLLLNGNMLDNSSWLAAFKWLEANSVDVDLSPFEFYTLSALYLAYQASVEVLLLEVGMGGRYDAVNVIDPDYAVITEIDLDHTERLGETVSEIAYQKAGIMRADRPAIFAGKNAINVFEDYAAEIGAKLYLCQNKFIEKPQALALPSALAALKLSELLPFDISKEIESEVKNFSLSGRFELLAWQNKPVVFDVAHNPAAMKNLSANLKHAGFAKVGLWISLTNTKDAKQCIASLQEVVTMACVSKHSDIMAHDCLFVSNILLEAGIRVLKCDVSYENANKVFQRFYSAGCDVVVVTGSFQHVAMVKNSM